MLFLGFLVERRLWVLGVSVEFVFGWGGVGDVPEKRTTHGAAVASARHIVVAAAEAGIAALDPEELDT
jgi:hypothetical protein